MATKQMIEKLVDEINEKEPQQGLPLINQMIEDDLECEGAQSIRVAGAWMTNDELVKYAELVLKEGIWVSTQTCDNESIMLNDYGVRDGDTDDGDMYGTAGMTDIEAILHITRTHDYWGEWIGGCVGTFPNFSKQLQNELRPVLIHAIEVAVKNGVDH